jgi:three-Cys-motif partner protein
MPRQVGSWTQDKLKILRQYLPGYLLATTRAIERIYIDAFAGPGLNRLRRRNLTIDGSPLIALDACARNGTKFDHLFFIERDPALAAELSGVLNTRDETQRATVIVGDVNKELPKLITQLHQRSPTFVFIDPDGIEPQWTTIEAIAPWRTELLINFPLGMSINRNPDSAKVTAYFGTAQWRALWNLPARTHELLQLYKERLRRVGYQYTTEDDRLVKTSRGQHLYYLVFVSKVLPAKKIMTWVLAQPDSAGQTRMGHASWGLPINHR